mmetsp:Transcript_38780/g.117145  ORF Transcript_38780/g.117145 Transcript_38780/m.117145 type:complete len:216 (-) Transcript_38780:283-930(-)
MGCYEQIVLGRNIDSSTKPRRREARLAPQLTSACGCASLQPLRSVHCGGGLAALGGLARLLLAAAAIPLLLLALAPLVVVVAPLVAAPLALLVALALAALLAARARRRVAGSPTSSRTDKVHEQDERVVGRLEPHFAARREQLGEARDQLEAVRLARAPAVPVHHHLEARPLAQVRRVHLGRARAEPPLQLGNRGAARPHLDEALDEHRARRDSR